MFIKHWVVAGQISFIKQPLSYGRETQHLLNMEELQHFQKYKIHNRSEAHLKRFRTNRRQMIVLTVLALLIGPVIILKNHRGIPPSMDNYIRLIGYCCFIALPLFAWILWLQWRESVKLSRGYVWLGKFKVVEKLDAWMNCYFIVEPGQTKLPVDRDLFQKTNVGNTIIVCRNSLGQLEYIRRVNHQSKHSAKNSVSRFLRSL